METISAERCCEALDRLTSIAYEGEKPEYEEALDHRLTILYNWLEKEQNIDLKSSLDDIVQSDIFQLQDTNNISVRLSLTVLALLELLRRCLEAVRAAARPLQSADAPPPDALSVSRRRTVARGVQLAVALSVLPALPAGVGVPLEQRSEFSAEVRATSGRSGEPYQRRELAVLAVERLLPLTSDRTLADTVLPGHAADLLAALLLVTAAPLAPAGRAGMTPERRQHLQQQRDRLLPQLPRLLASLPDSVAVRELLLLQRCAANSKPPRRWLHERAAWWIFQYVRRVGGLVCVTDGLLQFWGQDRLDDVPLERIQAVAKLLVSPHPDFNDEQYFTHLAGEVLSLLRIRRQEVRVTTLRVAGALTACLWDCAAGRGCVQTAIIEPLLGPLSAGRRQSAPEAAVTDGVTAAWQLLVTGSAPDSAALHGLLPHAAALFQLYVTVRGGVSQLRTPSRELLERLVCSGRLGGAPQLLDRLLLADGVGEGRRLALGDTGGVRVELVPPDEADNWLIDDDDAAAAFATLLGAAGAPELVADVFTSLLERMRSVMTLDGAAEDAGPPPAVDGDALCAWERERTEKRRAFRHGLLTLRALAAMADCEQAREGLRDAARLLPVVQALLESFSSGGDDEPGLLRVETVCLAMGVLAGLLGGESSTAPVWAAARRLLPALQRLAQQEAGSERVRDMAADLRQLVLTNGVVNHQPLTADRYRARHHRQAASSGVQRSGAGPAPQQTDGDERSGEGRVKSEHRPPLVTVLGSRDNEMGTESRLESPVKTEPHTESFVKTEPHFRTSVKTEPHLESGLADGETSPSGAALQRPSPPCTAGGPPDRPAGQLTYQRAMYDLVDPLLPVRAHALLSLSRLLERRDPETWRHRQHLLHVFQEKVADDDSYVYLAAVRGLACLADLSTDQVVPTLCRELTSRGRHADTETRLKLGEALVLMVRNLGDMAPKYGPLLLNTLLSGCRDPEPLVRASSLSSLSEICRLLRFSLAAHVHEIFGCLSALVDTDPAIEVRRAAVLVISQLLDGLGTDALKVLEDLLLALYRRLKVLLRREQDPAMLHHVQTALDRLEAATRQLLFPAPPRRLEKHITVLGGHR